MPEGLPYDEEAAKLLTGLCHKVGISQGQYEELYRYYHEFQAKQWNAYQEQQQAGVDNAIKELKTKWGEESYDANLEVAKRAIKAFASDEQVELLNSAEINGVKLGDHPMIVELFHRVGQKLSSDDIVKGGGAATTEAQVPDYPNSPEMYEDDPKWRPYFEARGHKY
jgi:hypothetical protein